MHILKPAFVWCILIIGFPASFVRSEPLEHVAAAKLTREAIIGAWRLVGIEYSGPNGSLKDPVFGPNPQGIMIYDSSGWMSVQIASANRPTIAGPASRTSGVVTTDDAKLAAQAVETYYAYFGSWEFDAIESVITHHLQASLPPYETVVDYRREVSFDGVHLKLIARSQQNGESRQRTFLWTKVADSGLIAAPSAASLASAQGTSRSVDSAAAVAQTEPPLPTRVMVTKYGDMPTDYKEAIRKYFLEHLKYPDSVQYQSITMPEQGFTTTVTGTFLMSERRKYGWTVKATINAKDSHDHYVGFKTYAFLFRGETIVDARLPLPGDELN
jgi:hypothetical protein